MADTINLPIAISLVQGRYLLFDIDAITYLRRKHHVCGVFIGTLPQNPSQNVFMGLPMELMPEEAQMLLEEAVCYVLDDARAHDVALLRANRQRQNLYVTENEALASEIAGEKSREKELEKRRAMKKVKVKRSLASVGSSTETITPTNLDEAQYPTNARDEPSVTDDLFASSENPTSAAIVPQTTLSLTPTTSSTLFTANPTTRAPRRIPNLNIASYNLYKHLNSKSYFQTPGLRFGCQFSVYPGDPLRFHSHFLAVGYQWEEEIDLMDVVGGGRLGTGVKKGWLMGAKEPNRAGIEGKVRTWSVEWAGM